MNDCLTLDKSVAETILKAEISEGVNNNYYASSSVMAPEKNGGEHRYI